jgi:hypothetical protein
MQRTVTSKLANNSVRRGGCQTLDELIHLVPNVTAVHSMSVLHLCLSPVRQLSSCKRRQHPHNVEFRDNL